MLYIKLDQDRNVVDAYNGRFVQGFETVQHSAASFAEAEKFAAQLTAHFNKQYIPVDHGAHCYPRFDVVEAPVVGEPVSYAFNGDSYECGYITKVSSSLKRVETSTGRVFYRRKLSGVWLNGKTWSMVHGHVNELNPSF
jgi:hypothetical protein